MQKVAGHCGKCGAPYFEDAKWDGEGVPTMEATCVCWNMNSPYFQWWPIYVEPWPVPCYPPSYPSYPLYPVYETGDFPPYGGWTTTCLEANYA